MMKNKQILLKGILFIAIFIILLSITSFIFMPKNNSRAAGMHEVSAHGILAEKENTIDMIVVGDSESYSAISPLQIWDEYGFTSYVCGSPKQFVSSSYQYLLKALKTQKPKVVILETNSLFRKYTLEDYVGTNGQTLFPIFEYHNRWKTITKEDFYKDVEYTTTDSFKGYHYYKDTKSSPKKKHMKKTQVVKEISYWNEYYYHKIDELCKENDIELILVSVPSTKNWSYQKHNGVQKLAKKTNRTYVDLNLEESLMIDWDKDTRDKGDHLNYLGAKKVTEYLGKYLYNQGLLENHKQDVNYMSWNEDLKKYNKKIHQ